MRVDTWPARFVRGLGYALTALPIGLIGFVVVVAGLATGVGTLVIWIGLPILVGTLMAIRGLAQVERLRLARLRGRATTVAHYRRAAPGSGRIAKVLTPLRDVQSWLDAVWGLLAFATSLIAFCVVVPWIALTASGLTYWFWQRWLPEPDDSLAELIGLGAGRGPESWLNLGIGVVALLTLPLVTRLVVLLHSSLGEMLLNTRGELESQVARAEGAREAAQAAEAVSLRRLERDIHDGPQQRLVRLSMDLGRARKQVTDDPERAAATIDSALAQARETVEELRALSRGIAPPLLVDRGLAVALDELVARSDVPVDLQNSLPGELAPEIETAVYFTVSEALTNVAKHAQASAVGVRVVSSDQQVHVDVHDDGLGGAHLAKGQGLAGLAQRIAAVNGTFEVDSPLGGPTTLRAVIPLR